jgi:hypothetical protein
MTVIGLLNGQSADTLAPFVASFHDSSAGGLTV